MKTGFSLFKILWKSYPNLESMQMFFSTSEVLRSSLGMYHSCSGRHPVHRSRLYLQVITQTVFMLYGAFQKIGKGRQSNMGVRCDIKILVILQGCRTHMVYKYKGSDRSFLAKGQQAAHQKISDICGFFFND